MLLVVDADPAWSRVPRLPRLEPVPELFLDAADLRPAPDTGEE